MRNEKMKKSWQQQQQQQDLHDAVHKAAAVETERPLLPVARVAPDIRPVAVLLTAVVKAAVVVAAAAKLYRMCTTGL